MVYTITSAKDFASGQKLQLLKNGHRYMIWLINKEELTKGYFATIEDAQKKYIELLTYFIKGLYSYEQRAEKLTKEI